MRNPDRLIQNRYQIIRPIGQGGMGTVYEALDQHLGHTVALKQILRGSKQDFEGEARLLACLHHPALPKVTDHFCEDRGQFLVMEFIPGDDLETARMRQQRLFSPPEVLRWAKQLLEALAYLHAQTPPIIHRDLKPANLKLNSQGDIILLDFGLAKGKNGAAAEPTQSIPGYTLNYAAPEQIRGEGTDARSDLYSLAATLYNLLTGHKPPDAMQRALALANGQLDPLTFDHPQLVQLPPALIQVLRKALMLMPTERFANAQTMLTALKIASDETAYTVAPAAPTAPTPAPSSARPAALVLRQTPHNLPAQLTPLIGREEEVGSLQDRLRQHTVRLVTLTGPGGIGKTRLGQQVAQVLLADFPDGVFFVGLASIREPNLVVSTIAQTLGVREVGSTLLLQSVQAHLQGKTTLLLLDNFEQVIDAAPLLIELLTACPDLKMLVTSREVLRVRGEQEFSVPPLRLPDLTQPFGEKTLAQIPALHLFVQRAQAFNPAFTLDSTNARAVAELCVQLDGLPLAIELAAVRIKVLSPQAMLERLGDRFKFLRGGPRDLPDRQRTLQATLDWSYDLLTEAEKPLFRRLAVFVGGCTLEAADQVCNPPNAESVAPLQCEMLDGLTSLVDKSLLYQQAGLDGESRFMMLATIREYATARLAEGGEEEELRRLHSSYYLALAEQAKLALKGGDQALWLHRLETEYDNLRAVLHWATKRKDHALALSLGVALEPFWDSRGYASEGSGWLQEILMQSRGLSTMMRANALNAAGNLAKEQGNYAAARSLHHEALALRRALDDKPGIAGSLGNLGNIARQQGDYATARLLLEECLARFKALGNLRGVAITLLNLGAIVHEQKDYQAARMLYEESLTMHQEIGDQHSVAKLFVNLGNLSAEQDEFTLAHAYYEKGLAIQRQLGDKEGIATTLLNQGITAFEEGKYEQAKEFCEEALPLQEEVGEKWGIAHSLLYLGNVALAQEDYTMARTFYRQGLVLQQALEDKRLIISSLEAFAALALAGHNAEQAVQLFARAESLREAIKLPISTRDQVDYDHHLASARANLGEEAFSTAWATGQAMTLEQVIALALQET